MKKCLNYLSSTPTLFYYCALISAWDDRSWFFLVGIYLVLLDPRNLSLTAIFGFLSSGSVLLFGSVIGSWTDKTSRLRAMWIILTIRNLSTLICSICLCLVLFHYDQIVLSERFPKLYMLAKLVVIITGVSARLTGIVNNTTLTKDWLPILCLKNSELLSNMASRLKLIDMICKIIAPIIIGQIITFAGRPAAAIVFSVQVMVTLVLICFLLHVIYRRMPRLHYREDTDCNQNTVEDASQCKDEENGIKSPFIEQPSENKRCTSCILFVEGWLVYYKQKIVLAGLSLALLYMTVLGFDSVTIGYAISQGVSESILSFYNAGAAFTGILGALLFPRVVKITNIVSTGILSLSLQFIGLIPCIISVWATGSSFNLVLENATKPVTKETEATEAYTYSNNNSYGLFLVSLTENKTIVNNTMVHDISYTNSYGSLSVILLMSGIIASRIGLWMFDLTANQLLVECVEENHRGKVNGVQNAMNMLLDQIKFVLVFILPLPRQFGLLILLSVGSIGLANILYLVFAIRTKCKISSHL